MREGEALRKLRCGHSDAFEGGEILTSVVDPIALQHLHEVEFEISAKDAEKRLEFADSYAHAGLKSLFLVNGAAIVALLTFAGNADLEFDKRGIFWSFAWFSIGICFNITSYFGAYFNQNFYMITSTKRSLNAKYAALGIPHTIDESKDMRTGNIWIGVAILSAVLSFVLFVTGAFVALVAIT